MERRVTVNAIRFVLVLGATSMILLGCAEGGPVEQNISAEDQDSKRPYKELVSGLLKKELEKRVQEYLTVAQDLDVSSKYVPSDKRNLHCFVSELVLQKDFSGLEELNGKMADVSVKKALWACVSRLGGDEGEKLLKKWALAHPSQPELLRYHPKGKTLLLDKIGNEDLPVTERVMCVRIIAEIGDVDMVPRLKKWINDETPVAEVSAKERRTMGNIVKDCIIRLEQIKEEEKKRSQEKEKRQDTKK